MFYVYNILQVFIGVSFSVFTQILNNPLVCYVHVNRPVGTLHFVFIMLDISARSEFVFQPHLPTPVQSWSKPDLRPVERRNYSSSLPWP